MLAVFVSLKVRPDRFDQFLEGIERNANSAVRDEPGCKRFDVCADREDPLQFYLYEWYVDADALAEHRMAPHYLAWREVVHACVEPDTMAVRTSELKFSPPVPA